ncbi:KRAB-A domain-containing protein 2-like [Palaemon carinicauda]|uniref:KRAB-A domain-containing protein 2-like n=1 Tax=Palaemon carinicauda TaxID=392227 RepID=UPI0035B6920A
MKYSSTGLQKKLIKRRSTRQESPLYYVSIEETFDVVKSAHISTGYGGRDQMLKELKKKYANIPTKAVELFKSLCHECKKKRKWPMTKGVVVRPILTKEFSSRGQVDLIDMQSMPSGSNKKWIMVYQDHWTKFCILRALTSKRAAEVAFHLLDIFLLFGAPVILQSGNGSEFTSQVITELKGVRPKLTLVHGKPHHPQSQGSVERANGDIKDMLVAWMADNNSKDWPTGIKFAQFQKNSALHSGIKCSSYSAMFGFCRSCSTRFSKNSTPAFFKRLQSASMSFSDNLPEFINASKNKVIDPAKIPGTLVPVWMKT